MASSVSKTKAPLTRAWNKNSIPIDIKLEIENSISSVS
jgi:hypothetical protein